MANNKMLKGALAGATGVALLAGGFGSFALFTDQESLPSGALNTGVLSIAAGPETYTDVSPGAVDPTWDPASDEMVPGDVIAVDMDLTVTARGKNLKATLDFAGLDLSEPELGDMLTVDYDFDVLPDSETGTAEAGVVPGNLLNQPVAFTEGDGQFQVSGVATFTLDAGANQVQADAAEDALVNTDFKVTQDARNQG